MKPVEDGSALTVCTDDENFDGESAFETSLEILYGTECENETTDHEKITDAAKHSHQENEIKLEIIPNVDVEPSEDEDDKSKDDDDDDAEDLEAKIQNAVEILAEELNRAAEVIREEKEQIERELQGYKELRDMFDLLSKDYDGIAALKPKPLPSHQNIANQCRKAENLRHTISSATVPMKFMKEYQIPVMTTMNPWFYSKCLQDAEKFCNQQMERVRRCISVSSINSHGVDVGTQNPSCCKVEISQDTHQTAPVSNAEKRDDVNLNWNHNTCSWRQQLMSSRCLEKGLISSMERGDSGDKDASCCIRFVNGSIVNNQITCTGDPCYHN